MAFGEPVLTQSFHLRGHDGTVRIRYTSSDAPESWGFDLLNISFPLDEARGYPAFQAEIAYGGPGYRTYMGWIQLITNRNPDTGEAVTSVDQAPIHEGIDTPFVTFGSVPTFFDAPANPDHETEDWIAETFLAVCLDIARTPRVAALLGIRWGYRLRKRQATPLPVEALPASTWDAHLPFLRAEYPRWSFDAGFHG